MHPLFIDGGWEAGAGLTGIGVENPATLEVLDTVPVCGVREIDRALAAARAAQASWSGLDRAERAYRLRVAALNLRASAHALGLICARETGMPLLECLDLVAASGALLESAAQRLEQPDEAPRGAPDDPGAGHPPQRVLPGPFCPLLELAARAIPALEAGRTAIVCAPASAPLACLAWAHTLGLPAGVIAVLTGDAGTRQAFEEHRAWPVSASADVAPTARSPLEVLAVAADADLPLAAAAIAAHRLFYAGQRPMCSTVLVEQPIVPAFLEQMHVTLALLEAGDPAKRITDLGPLVSANAVHQVQVQVAHALKRGGRLVLGGRQFQPWGLTGHFFQPTLFTRNPEPALIDEQIPGPVVAVCAVNELGARLGPLLADRVARLTVCGSDPERLRIALAGAGVPCRFEGAAPEGHPLIARMLSAWVPVPVPPLATALSIEHVSQRAPWWFPYAERRI